MLLVEIETRFNLLSSSLLALGYCTEVYSPLTFYCDWVTSCPLWILVSTFRL